MSTFQSSLEDFKAARQQAAMQSILARLSGRSNELLPYDETVSMLKPRGSIDRGRQQVPIAAIVGSLGRYTDFTRSFLPRKWINAERWANVRVLATSGPGLPPVKLYQVGSAYFVIDGHHRISVARQDGAESIEAFVTEVRTLVPLEPDTTPDELIRKAEYADFLEQTHWADVQPDVDLQLTELGQYPYLLEQVEAHRQYLSQEANRLVPLQEAMQAWYQQEYLPLVMVIRERGLLRYFPQRSETDLYLWITRHRAELEQELGWQVSPSGLVTDWAAHQARETRPDEDGDWRKTKLLDRYSERLFPDLLLPFSGTQESWTALDQALTIARLEQAYLCGLHVTRTPEEHTSEQVSALQASFDQRCQAAGVAGNLALESGPIALTICERALLTDLVILPVTYPPAEKSLARLGSGLRTIILQCNRPILAVTGEVSQFQHGLLVYDGSPRAQEALFLALYLAERWHSRLTVATALHGKVTPQVQEQARAYCEFHETQAEFVQVQGDSLAQARALLQQAYHDHGCDFILMGAYSGSLLKEMRLGSLVDTFLREMHCPIFICR